MKLKHYIKRNFTGNVARFSRHISRETGRNIRRQTVEYWIAHDYDWLDGSVCKRLTEPKS